MIDIFFIFILISCAPLSIIYFPVGFISITPYRIAFLLTVFFIISKCLLLKHIRISRPLLFSFLSIFVVYTIGYLRHDPLFQHEALFVYLEIIIFFSSIFIITLLIGENIKKLSFAINYLTVSACIICILGLIDFFLRFIFNINIWSNLSQYHISKAYLECPRISSTFFDVNLFAYYLFMPFAIMVFSFLTSSENYIFKDKKLNILSLMLLSVSILSTISRSGIICSILIIFFMIVTKRKFSRKKLINFFLSIGMILICLIILIKYIDMNTGIDYLYMFSDRITKAEYLQHDDSRILRIKSGINALKTNIFFGVGLGNLSHFMPHDIRKPEIITAHSLYLDIVSSVGLIGLTCFFSFIFYLIRRLYKLIKSSPNKLGIPLIYSLLALLVTQLIYSNFFHPALAIEIGIMVSYSKLMCNSNLSICKQTLDYI